MVVSYTGPSLTTTTTTTTTSSTTTTTPDTPDTYCLPIRWDGYLILNSEPTFLDKKEKKKIIKSVV